MSKHVTPSGHGTGWLPSIPDMRDYLFAAPTAALAVLPEVVDLRESGYLPAVMDQLPLGSCTANGGALIVKFALNKQGKGDLMGLASRLQIYYDERVLRGTTDHDSGAAIRDIFQVLASKGAAHNRLWPYDISRYRERPPEKAYADALNFQALQYARVTQSQSQMQGTLAAGYPIVFGCTLYESFEYDRTLQTGVVPMPRLGEKVLGGHCMVLIGYFVMNGVPYFIVQNSWGTGVGDEGFFYIPFGYILDPRITSDIWVLTELEAAA